jgi:hypothetical protein
VREKALTIFVQAPEEMNDEREKYNDDNGHSGGHHIVDAGGGFYAAEIQHREGAGVEDGEGPIGHERENILRELAANDGAD